MPKKRNKVRLKQAVERLTAITEKHLSTLPEDEQELRVANFERSVLTLRLQLKNFWCV